jgi:hypothetical protein
MKLRAGVLLILVSTVALFGAINLLVGHAAKDERVPVGKQEVPAIKAKELPTKANTPRKRAENTLAPAKKDELSSAQVPPMPDADRQLIAEVAQLPDGELVVQMKTLQERLNDGDLLDRYDQDELSPSEKAQARQLMERVALLGLENTRRRYRKLEPAELENPYFAHRDSLREIRQILDEDEEDR